MNIVKINKSRRRNNNSINNKTRRNNNRNFNINMYRLNSNIYKNFELENYKNNYIPVSENAPVDILIENYIFKMIIDEDFTNYILRFTSNTTNEPCIIIFINKENQTEATLEKVFHSEGCSYSETPLENKNGTILMIQTALKIAYDIFKKIKYFKLKDMSFRYNQTIKDNVWITPRRLLQEKEGWYEEYLGATPTNDTKRLKLIIKKTHEKINEYIPKNDLTWWTTKNILEVTMRIDGNFLTNNILATYWFINIKKISEYNINYRIPNISSLYNIINNSTINNKTINRNNMINNNFELNKFFKSINDKNSLGYGGQSY